jgi:hypothetical protein
LRHTGFYGNRKKQAMTTLQSVYLFFNGRFAFPPAYGIFNAILKSYEQYERI